MEERSSAKGLETVPVELLMLVGDVHGYFSHVLTVLDNARNKGARRVFFLGDFGAWEHTPGGVQFFDDVNRYAQKRGITVYFLDGNHDKTSHVMKLYGDKPDEEGFLIVRPFLRYAPRGHRWTWGGTRFIALGGAYSVDKEWRLAEERARARMYSNGTTGHPPWSKVPPGEYVEATAESLWFPEEEMTDEQFAAILAADSSPVDIILSHDKPRGSNLRWNRKDLFECFPNQDRLQRALVELKAKRLYHGHLHYPYTDRILTGDGRYAWVFGLDCDPRAAEHPNYRKEDSWTIVHLPFDD